MPYDSELAALGETYRAATSVDVGQLAGAVDSVGRGSAVYIGSGGTMAVASLAAQLHERCFLQPARPATSLEALELPQIGQRGAVLFSSSAKHPDAHQVLADFRRARFAPAALVTHRRREDLEKLIGPDTQVVQLPPPAQPDGFLATASVMQIAVLLLRAFFEHPTLPRSLNSGRNEVAQLREEVLVLTPPTLQPVATDIEVRLVESGLASVQVADFRNFAHGRHTGFARRLERVSVLILSDENSRALADATEAALPVSADIRRWHHEGEWPAAIVELLHRSMLFVGAIAKTEGLDPARPKVPVFGRKLYRLSLGRRVGKRLVGGIDRKLLALGAGDAPEERALYVESGAEWIAGLKETRFGGLVLDYDGTVCWTSRRYELPGVAQQEALVSLLEQGLFLGFASGRGRSLHRDLREWIPAALWERVEIGLYNGSVVLPLHRDLPDLPATSAWSREVMAAIGELPIAQRLEFEERGAQVSASLRGRPLQQGRLAEALNDRLASAAVEAQVLSSAHSVDIVSREACKTRVSDALRVRIGEGVELLVVGDQGQIGGNDHSLLASSEWSLTVDRNSADPTRCWFLGSGESVGPDLLLRYLKALRKRRGGFALGGLALQ